MPCGIVATYLEPFEDIFSDLARYSMLHGAVEVNFVQRSEFWNKKKLFSSRSIVLSGACA